MLKSLAAIIFGALNTLITLSIMANLLLVINNQFIKFIMLISLCIISISISWIVYLKYFKE